MGGVILHQAAAGLLRLHDEHDIPSASRLPADQAERGVLPVVHDEAGQKILAQNEANCHELSRIAADSRQF